jgi:hypothetical protein
VEHGGVDQRLVDVAHHGTALVAEEERVLAMNDREFDYTFTDIVCCLEVPMDP